MLTFSIAVSVADHEDVFLICSKPLWLVKFGMYKLDRESGVMCNYLLGLHITDFTVLFHACFTTKETFHLLLIVK